MADPWTVAGVVSTWVAVAIALVALVGIVTPILIFWHRRSDRYKALVAVDAVQTHYVEKSWKTMFFLRMSVPALKEPPNVEKIPLRVSKYTSLPVKTSSTGWVNFASALEIYTLQPKLPRRKDLVIAEEQTWLPVHKLWILAFGLLGRYSYRKDHGTASHKRNAWRLEVEEDSSNIDEERQHFQSSREEYTDLLDGLTGYIWWIGSYSNYGNDNVYFGRHSTADQQELTPDPTPLSTLFWLSMGCIPLVYPKGYVYDLADFRPPYDSTKGDMENSVDSFYRYKLQIIQPSDYMNKVAKATGASTHTLWRIEKYSGPKERESDERESVKEKSNKQWINEVGSTREEMESPRLEDQEVKKRNIVDRKGEDEDDHHERERHNLRARNPINRTQKDWVQTVTNQGYVHFWRTDIDKLAYAVISLPLGPQGFLFSQTRHFPNFNYPGQLWSLIELIVPSGLVGVTEKEMKEIKKVGKLPVEDDNTRLEFRRHRMATLYKCHQTIQQRDWAIPQIVRDIIGVLTLTSGFMSDVLNSMEAKKTVCLEVNAEAEIVRMYSSNNGHDPIIGEYYLAFARIFDRETLCDELDDIFRSTPQQQTDIILTCLSASLQERMVRGQLSSEFLINTFKKMGDIVHVSSRIQIPRLRRRPQRVGVKDPTATEGEAMNEDSE